MIKKIWQSKQYEVMTQLDQGRGNVRGKWKFGGKNEINGAELIVDTFKFCMVYALYLFS